MSVFLILIAVLITFFSLPSHFSLLIGVGIGFFIHIEESLLARIKKISTYLLQFSVVLLGSQLTFNQVLNDGFASALLTFVSITIIFGLGYLGTKIFKLDQKLAQLITMGTAICGGSAIAALSSVLKADSSIVAISLGIVFLLNAVSVFIFPPLGHFFNLSQNQFGVFSALAIHDTSSVVAAASLYGEEALKVATTFKLTRALWIIPITILFSLKNKLKGQNKITIPWFIFLFLLVSILFTNLEPLAVYKIHFIKISKLGLSLTLFLIGLGFNLKKIKSVGLAPFFFSIVLWLIVIVGSFFISIYNY